MIRLTQFRVLLETTRRNPFNTRQWDVVRAGPTGCLHVVAGSGTGKTTSLVGRILKLIFVDQLPPGSILATTFHEESRRGISLPNPESGHGPEECDRFFRVCQSCCKELGKGG